MKCLEFEKSYIVAAYSFYNFQQHLICHMEAGIEATVLGSLVPISKAEICDILPDVSPTTVEAVLSKMVKDGQIKKIGQSRTTRYVKA